MSLPAPLAPLHRSRRSLAASRLNESHAIGLTYVGTPCDNAHRKAKGGETKMLDRITIDPRQMNGQPCIRGTRLTVRRVLELLAIYPTRAELYSEYPFVEEADIQQALAYAATYLEDRVADLESAEP